jgi:tRNA A37 threonylcarbamoyladenosine dehydratase
VVAGLGAVGSYAVEGLSRAGIGRLRLVDFDIVRSSNINRQLYALESTLGQSKVDLACRRVRDINPHCQVEGLNCFVDKDSLENILSEQPDIIIDAIDSLNPKTELLAGVLAKKMRVLSSMGAALKRDPTQIRIGPLDKVTGCSLARMVRKRLRHRGVAVAFPCVYSMESPVKEGMTEGTEPDFLIRGRTRLSLGSLPTITGIFGLNLAHAAIELLLQNAGR